MVEGKSYTSSFSRRKLVSVHQESSSQTTHLLFGFNEIEVLEGKSYTSSFSRRKFVSVHQESSSQTTHLLFGFNEIEVLL